MPVSRPVPASCCVAGLRLTCFDRARPPDPNALLSFKLIDALGIWSSIFFLPPAAQETLSSTPSPSSDALAAASILEQLISPPSTSTLPALHPRLPQLVAAAERKRLFLAAAAAPYRELEVKKKKQTLPAPEVVIKESIKVRRPAPCSLR